MDPEEAVELRGELARLFGQMGPLELGAGAGVEDRAGEEGVVVLGDVCEEIGDVGCVLGGG